MLKTAFERIIAGEDGWRLGIKCDENLPRGGRLSKLVPKGSTLYNAIIAEFTKGDEIYTEYYTKKGTSLRCEFFGTGYVKTFEPRPFYYVKSLCMDRYIAYRIYDKDDFFTDVECVALNKGVNNYGNSICTF
jgi:hypothetical protein